jgi:hypothetical protein
MAAELLQKLYHIHSLHLLGILAFLFSHIPACLISYKNLKVLTSSLEHIVLLKCFWTHIEALVFK